MGGGLVPLLLVSSKPEPKTVGKKIQFKIFTEKHKKNPHQNINPKLIYDSQCVLFFSANTTFKYNCFKTSVSFLPLSFVTILVQ